MKKLTILLLVLVSLSCSKNKESVTGKKCYKCEAISQGRTYNEDVCSTGDPYEKLPKQDSGGNLGWICTEK